MLQQMNNPSSTMSNQGNRATQEENDDSPETKLEVMEESYLNTTEFKRAAMKNLDDIRENSERQVDELRSKINEQKN